MKVLKKGRKQKGWSKEFVCTGKGNGGGGCGALLLVEQDDVYLTFSYDYDGGRNIYKTFCCSECEVETDFSDVLPFEPPPKPRKPSATDPL